MFIYIKLFLIFFKVGLFSFGGGYAMLPMIYKDIQTFGLMNANEFSDVVAISQMTPGPIAINAATYVGFRSAGFWGSFFATIGVSLPSIIIILIISSFFYKFKSSPIVESVLKTIRPATAGMIGSAAVMLLNTSVFTGSISTNKLFTNPLGLISIPALIIFALTIAGSVKLKLSPITLTVLAGVAGAFII